MDGGNKRKNLGWAQRIGRIRSITALLILLGLLLSACQSTPPEPAYVREAGLLARASCFGVEHLPPGFEVMARQILDNQLAATRISPRVTLGDLQRWGRLSGAWLQYLYEPPSMPAEDADGFLTQEELEQALAAAQRERLSAPFASATCQLDLFLTPQGAQQAYRTLSTLIPGQALPHSPRGEESTLLIAPTATPGFVRLTLWFRVDTLVAGIFVTAACDPHSAGCSVPIERTESLAALVERRITVFIPGVKAPQSRAPATARALAEEACPERDYTSCVAEALSLQLTGQPAALCISPSGEWDFIPISSNEPLHSCPEEEWEIAAHFNVPNARNSPSHPNSPPRKST